LLQPHTKQRITPKRLLGQALYTRFEKQQAWEDVRAKLEKKKVN